MMRYMKKSIALLLSLLIMLSIFQGCSLQKKESVESKESETTAETTIADLKNNQTDMVITVSEILTNAQHHTKDFDVYFLVYLQ